MSKADKKSSKRSKTTTADDEDAISQSVRTKLKEFSKSIDSLKAALKPMTENLSEVESQSDAINKARLDLTAVYTINSLFWCEYLLWTWLDLITFSSFVVYLLSQGKNPKDHEVKRELDRLKVSMSRLRDIESNESSKLERKIDSSVAKRVIKHTLSLNNNANEAAATSTGSKRFKK